MNYDLSFVVTTNTITVTCYSWSPSSSDHLFICGTISRPPHNQIRNLCVGHDCVINTR